LAAIQNQDSQIKSGAASDTGAPPEFFLTPPAPGNGQNVLDPASYQTAAHPPLTAGQFQALNQVSSKGPSNVGPGGRPLVPLEGR